MLPPDQTPEEVAEPIARRPSPRPPTLREQRALTVKRVLEEYQRSGVLPPTLRQQLIDEHYSLRWLEGQPMPREAVERHVDQWAADLLSRFDKKMEAV